MKKLLKEESFDLNVEEKLKRKGSMKNAKGFSLIELLVAVAIGGITSLVMATIFIFSAQSFQSLIDQNQAEESILLSSYYLRATLGQAVKLRSVNNSPMILFNPAVKAPPTAPTNVAVGYLDNRRTCAAALPGGPICAAPMGTAWTVGVVNTFALFLRENGGIGALATGSDFLPTGIFYRPYDPAIPGVSGRLYIAQTQLGNSLTDTNAALVGNSLTFDNIVAFGIAPGNAVTCPATVGSVAAEYDGTIPCVNLYVRTRYFKQVSTQKSYDPDPVVANAAGSVFRDIDMIVNINLRNNIVNISSTGYVGKKERVNAGVYFYRFAGPSLMEF